ncbi:uncharacterized protein SPSK_00288 [Sporothrix schenckii 1099-18]|uniref:Mitochondrial resolvase Ydc2 catalytic domain-containing protein n=1 Tax=Sporothrix schenckii 1099-18 TaxID=1397361 RepID=A0A0F2M2T2_SPOSC|nr:uncharacterized protein SPSK_00288 [Sporothrix schenckii 1099-18]KJR84002.1 hypothetical protein SPSK_00288 [Sporothrix schenckii 1099-18]
MASLSRGRRPMQALFPPICAFRDASLAVTRCSRIAPPPSARQCFVTTAKAKEKRAPTKKVKQTTEPHDDTAAQDPHLPPLSLTALRDLAVLCGRNSSGTRAVLRADLEAAINEAMPAQKRETAPPQPRRILSIDMGVRNLAYCLLHVAAPVPGQDHRARPTLVAWERLSLIGAGDNTEAGDSTTVVSTSAFSSPVLAAAAARLVRDRLLPLSPTHVLIERQRFRSGGAAAVLEWTVRVNSLEAMLHGIFAYRQLGRRSTAENTVQAVQAVSPQRASRFLLQGGMGGSSVSPPPPSTRKTKEKDIKDVKEAFVAGLLRTPGPTLAYDESIGGMVDAYLVRWDAKQSRGRGRSKDATNKAEDDTPKSPPTLTSTKQPALSKIDDLADCVAQGLIWLEWEANKTTLREKGAEALLAVKQLAG